MKTVLIIASTLLIGSLTVSCKKNDHTSPPTQVPKALRVWDALENTIIPNFEMRGETDEAALRFVISEIVKKNPEFEYVIHQSPTEGSPISIHLKNIPAFEAIRYICNVGNREYSIASGVLVISAGGMPLNLPLETQSFHVGMGDSFFSQVFKPQEQVIDVKQTLKAKGVKIPDDGSALYVRSEKKLVLHANYEVLSFMHSVLNPLTVPDRHLAPAGSYRFTAPSLSQKFPVTFFLNLFSDGTGSLWSQPLGTRTAPVDYQLKRWTYKYGILTLDFADGRTTTYQLQGFNLVDDKGELGPFRRFVEEDGHTHYFDAVGP